ncbi:MAG TPA: N-acetyl-gamma-glutamyl-phosphate reductase [Dehalococcoidia bacterium]|nr:N-acetyl-gamma-glutamyl-phosphate reductase [Dehalococcoidia bacterium]
MSVIRIGIINVTGYAGVELARLLHRHPAVKVTSVTGRSAVGQPLAEVFPHLSPLNLNVEAELGDVGFVFSALPHAASAEAVASVVEQGVPVVDLSADFRLRDPEEYRAWYGAVHPAPQLLAQAVYGLPELHRAMVAESRLVANPGCYATGAILALAPALKAGIIEPDAIIDGKSGISGAGRALSMTHHYSEINESAAAYGLDGHRHLPEMLQELSSFCSTEPAQASGLRLTFVPHYVPMTRGILLTCYAALRQGALPRDGQEAVRGLYQDFYRGEPFVRVAAQPPFTKHTLGNNLCLLYPTVDERTQRLVVVGCLDNLVKGAAGQAVQNMNLMLGLDEATGLDSLPLYP